MDRHHNAPPLADRLAIDHADLMKRATEAAELVPGTVRAIENDEEAAAYTDTASAIKAILKESEAAFKVEKAPWLEGGRAVDGFFAAVTGPMVAASKRAVEAVNTWQRFQLAAKRKAAEEAEKKARAEAIIFDEPAPAPVAPVVAKDAGRVVSFTGAKASASIKWKGEVTDADAVPRQYLMVNQSAIDAAIKGGIRSIPGVNIYEDVRTAIR